MKKTVLKFCMTAGVFIIGLCMAFQAQARMVQTDSKNIYNLNDEEFKTSLRAGLARINGTANEHVTQGSFSENSLSKLIWDFESVYLGGFGFSVQKQWVAIHGDLWFGLSDGDGVMDDYDWIMDGPSWSDWSHHDDTTVTDARIFDISAEFFIPRLSTDNLIFSLFLGFKYDFLKFEARGGSYIYSTTTYRDTTGVFSSGQLGITYEQTFKTPYIGVGLRGKIDNFELFGRFIGSTLAQADTDDIHHLRNMNISTKAKDGNMISFDLGASYKFLQHYSVELGYNHTSYDSLKGDAQYSTVVDGAHNLIEYVDAGMMDLETSTFSLNFNYSF